MPKPLLATVLYEGDDPDTHRIAVALRAALVPDDTSEPEESSSAIAMPLGDAEAHVSLEEAEVAITLDGASLERARAAGVRRTVAVLPFLSAEFGGTDLDADLVLVSHEAVVAEAVRGGAAKARIRVAGMVAPDGWAPVDDRSAQRARFEQGGLRTDVPWVVVRAQALEREDLAPALVQLSLVRRDVTWLFDVGVDADFARILRRRAGGYGLHAFMFAEGDDARVLYQAADLVVGRLDGPEAIRAFTVGAALVTGPPRGGQLRLAHAVEEAGLASIADAAATLSVTLDAALTDAALERARALSAELDPRGGAARVVEAVRALVRGEERPSLPAGLPRGLERIDEGDALPSSEEASRSPSGADDLDRKVDEELAALREKLGL